MPNYDFVCSDCGFTVTDVQLPIAERDYPTTQACPSCGKNETIQRCIAAPGVNYTINRGGLKTPDWTKDRLKEIKRQFPRSTINV
jgi:putative FmdB family regulatory protein